MASTYSNLKIQLMATGENSGTWGNVTNDNLGVAIEQALVETATVTFASANVTLSLTNTNASQTARALRLDLTGTTGGARDLIVPAIQKPYIVNNGTADTITVKVTGQTGVAVPAGRSYLLYNNGTDVVNALEGISVVSGGTGLETLTAESVVIGNGTNAVKFVAPGTTANILTSNGTAWVSQAPAGGQAFPSGTVMLFAQTTAPTGWTKNTTQNNNSALRLVTGSVSTGGNVDFSTVFVSNRSVNITSVTGSIGATTLTTPQIPSHTHAVNRQNGPSQGQSVSYIQGVTLSNENTTATGGGGSHTHPLSVSSGSGTVDLDVKYVDVIRATAD
jgi:hypothetical protein